VSGVAEWPFLTIHIQYYKVSWARVGGRGFRHVDGMDGMDGCSGTTRKLPTYAATQPRIYRTVTVTVPLPSIVPYCYIVYRYRYLFFICTSFYDSMPSDISLLLTSGFLPTPAVCPRR